VLLLKTARKGGLDGAISAECGRLWDSDREPTIARSAHSPALIRSALIGCNSGQGYRYPDRVGSRGGSVMAQKVIDVTLASITNTGTSHISPKGVINIQTVRAVDDEQVFQSENLYRRNDGQPMHPSGVQSLASGQSLTYGVTKRLTVSHFSEGESEGFNQMMIFDPDLMQDIVDLGSVSTVHYFGCFKRKVRFDELEGFQTIECLHNIAATADHNCRFTATYTINLASSSG